MSAIAAAISPSSSASSNAEKWLEAAKIAFGQVWQVTFSETISEAKAVVAEDTQIGALLPLVGENRRPNGIQLGLFSDKAGCQFMARKMFMMTPDEPDLPDEDVADALQEFANQMGGGAKRVVREDSFLLGLPIVIHGAVTGPKGSATAIGTFDVGGHIAKLVVMAGGG